MKRKLLLFFIVFIIGCYGLSLSKNGNINDINEDHVVKNNNLLSMMLETETDSNIYEMVTQSSWPTEGYVFNNELSGCENGGKLYWSDAEQKIIMESNVSDKCYVYFDKEENKVLLVDYVKSLYTGTQGENSIYYHDSNLANGASDNSYRFAGASNQVNNFVCFGTDETPCPNDNLYRIIGVIAGKVKLIKYDYANSNVLGTDGDFVKTSTPSSNYYKGNLTSIDIYYWNYKATNSASNTWSTSLLNKTNLNTNFITNIGEEWANKISMTTWKVGGNISANIVSVSSSSVYQNEIINPVTTKTTDNKTTYNAKIGLMYVSDYGFAAGSDAWTLNMDSYNNTIAANNNWMFMGNSEWTITRFADVSTDAINIQATGDVNALVLLVSRGVRVVFNLEPSLIYKSGMGSINDPIIIE